MKTYSSLTHSFASRSQSDWSVLSLGNRSVPAWFRASCLWLALLTPLCLFFCLASKASAQGALTNGAHETGTISPAGDTDTWTFSANAGDGIVLRVGATNFVPEIQLYGPDSALIGDAFTANGNFRDAELILRATNGGPYTVVISSHFPLNTGTYGLTLAQPPGTFVTSAGDEGGTLTNGVNQAGTMELGDLDMWSFTATAGDSLLLRMGATGFVPEIRLFGPDGALVADAFTINGNNRDAQLFVQATNSGLYTVVVGSYFLNNSGTYNLTLAKSPGAFFTSPSDEGGTLTNGFNQAGTIDL